jgi:hypothetical protein
MGGNTPPESAFFYEELRGSAECCREMMVAFEWSVLGRGSVKIAQHLEK